MRNLQAFGLSPLLYFFIFSPLRFIQYFLHQSIFFFYGGLFTSILYAKITCLLLVCLISFYFLILWLTCHMMLVLGCSEKLGKNLLLKYVLSSNAYAISQNKFILLRVLSGSGYTILHYHHVFKSFSLVFAIVLQVDKPKEVSMISLWLCFSLLLFILFLFFLIYHF